MCFEGQRLGLLFFNDNKNALTSDKAPLPFSVNPYRKHITSITAVSGLGKMCAMSQDVSESSCGLFSITTPRQGGVENVQELVLLDMSC